MYLFGRKRNEKGSFISVKIEIKDKSGKLLATKKEIENQSS